MVAGTELALHSLGEALRATRELQGLTLEQAAERSGLSKSHLSRLESSERQPSVASLLALSAAFGVPVSTLLGEAQETAPLTVSSPEEPRRESNGLRIAPCSGYAGSNLIDAMRVTISAERAAPVPVRHSGEEWLYVLGGTLLLEYDGELHSLETGCAAHFNAELPHRLGAEGAPAEVLLVAAKPFRNLHAIH